MRRTFITAPNLLAYWQKVFGHSGIPAAEAEVSLKQILEKVTGGRRQMQPRNLFPVARLSQGQVSHFNECCRRRATRMPLQYILEEWDFHRIALKMQPPVFIPRPETEELVDIVLSHVEHYITESGRSDITICEVGCGSGAISLALVSACSKIKCIAIDKSIRAVRLARENADRLSLGSRVEIYHAELLADGSIFPTESFCSLSEQPLDIIVSNPPYIQTDEKDKLDPEVYRFEDHDALFGGHDGLDIIRSILRFSLGHLKGKGQIFLEVGLLHPPIIQDILNSKEYQALKLIKVHRDFTKKERFIHLLLDTAFQK